MSEWDIVTALVVIVGLFFTVGNPIIKLNTNITILSETLKAVQRQHEKDSKDNTEDHRRIWKHNDEQDAMLEDHKLRLHDLDGK